MRYFYVKITTGTSQGPYNIYYDGVSTNYATLVFTSSNAVNVSYSDLTTTLGVLVSVPSGSLTVTLQNTKENCLFDVVYSVPPETFRILTDDNKIIDDENGNYLNQEH